MLVYQRVTSPARSEKMLMSDADLAAEAECRMKQFVEEEERWRAAQLWSTPLGNPKGHHMGLKMGIQGYTRTKGEYGQKPVDLAGICRHLPRCSIVYNPKKA